MWQRFKEWARNVLERSRQELRALRLIATDPRTPRLAKWMLAFAVGYLAMPFDIIPDFIPVLGQLDDILIVPTLIVISMKLTPQEVIKDCRRRAGAS